MCYSHDRDLDAYLYFSSYLFSLLVSASLLSLSFLLLFPFFLSGSLSLSLHFFLSLCLILPVSLVFFPSGGDPAALEAWRLICDVSRKEFAKVYERLDVTLEERGESFYNEALPGIVEVLTQKGSVLNARKR